MKKMIALGGAALCLAFASWTLHADDSAATSSSDSSYSSDQQAGTADSAMSDSEKMTKETKETTESHTQAMRDDQWKNAKSCTDENGQMHKKGTKSFKTCVETMRKKEQMGGMAPSDQSMDKSMDQSPMGTMDSSQR